VSEAAMAGRGSDRRAERGAADRDDPARGLRKRSVTIAGHRTSVSLEPQFWEALRSLAAARGIALGALIAEIDRGRDGNLSSALRLHVLETLQRRGGG
jgi:predicted DNA-binding ribbon-helix-helix protein